MVLASVRIRRRRLMRAVKLCTFSYYRSIVGLQALCTTVTTVINLQFYSVSAQTATTGLWLYMIDANLLEESSHESNLDAITATIPSEFERVQRRRAAASI